MSNPTSWHFHGNPEIKSWYNYDRINKNTKYSNVKIYSGDINGIDMEEFSIFSNMIKRRTVMNIDDTSIDRYKKFRYLTMKYRDVKLIPPWDVHIVWMTHLLDHENYMKDINYVLTRHSRPRIETSIPLITRTSKLWKMTFKQPYDRVKIDYEICSKDGVSDELLKEWSKNADDKDEIDFNRLEIWNSNNLCV